MPIARAVKHVLASWGVALLLTGCVLPMPDGDSPSSSYQGAGSGYSGASGGASGSTAGGARPTSTFASATEGS